MRTVFPLAGLGCLVALTAAQARVAPPPPLPLRTAAADLVVVGKVTGLAGKPVGEFQVVTFEVGEAVVGTAGKQIRVGFVPRGPAPIRRPAVSLSNGQEACLFLARHPTEKGLYVVRTAYEVLNKTGNPGYTEGLAEVKRAGKVLADPLTALKAKDPADRYEAAALLLTRYRKPTPGAKTEPLSAEQSKLILEALVQLDWERVPPRFNRMHPRQLFAQLGLTAADGWSPPKDFRQFNATARQWLKDNAGKFRVRRFVAADAGKSPEPGS